MLVVNAAVAATRAGHDVVLYTSHHDEGRCFKETTREGANKPPDTDVPHGRISFARSWSGGLGVVLSDLSVPMPAGGINKMFYLSRLPPGFWFCWPFDCCFAPTRRDAINASVVVLVFFQPVVMCDITCLPYGCFVIRCGWCCGF